MNSKDSAIALQTYDLTLQKLPPNLSSAVQKPAKDPAALSKHGATIAKIRLLPTDRSPACFWNSSWCFYEIGVGAYPASRANFGGIQFFMSPEQVVCGKGRYRNDVLEILRSLNGIAGRGFFLNSAGGGKGTAILCGRKYYLGDFSAFPVQTAATDLVWLITETLAKFASLK
ncbi:MAG: hypothetical protein HY301_15390 [Verrucomicrobia bacterium]|nr:hypothetical protein [Verrucomicrobiota bacterium]